MSRFEEGTGARFSLGLEEPGDSKRRLMIEAWLSGIQRNSPAPD